MKKLWCLLVLFGIYGDSLAQEFEREPIRYSQSTPANAISALQARIDNAQTELKFEEHFGYLRSILRELAIPESSQTLVFSKTSLQRDRISPETPRSIYFSDAEYVGFCQYGEVLEISATDRTLGTVFYTLDQQQSDRPRFVRQTDNCLLCHGSSHTQGVPGHLVRSVFPDTTGQPVFSLGTYRIDHTSEFGHRWGGWYVTGTHGDLKHFGNQIFTKSGEANEDVKQAMNLRDLSSRIDVDTLLTPHSDIVALMVLEHQAEGHNLIARANFLTRTALHYEASLRKELRDTTSRQWDSTTSRIKHAGEPLVKYLLFAGEAPLTARIQGTSPFAEDFVKRGPYDRRGRSLREFDLSQRLFRYSCSYLIYSDSFEALPDEVRSYIWERLWNIVTSRDTSTDFQHLSTADRQAIREILTETQPSVPSSWHQP